MPSLIDLTGKRFGKLVVVERAPNIGRRTAWKCACDCGGECTATTHCLRKGYTKSCGCLGYRETDYVGKRFGRLTVIENVGVDKHRHKLYRCLCDCGNYTIVSSNCLGKGTSSCGCLIKERTIESHTKHGGSGSRLYQIYHGMISRCENPNSQFYHCYGGRGISVCHEWRNDFAVFREWAMGNGYDPDAAFGECTIDRVDVNGNYEPDNCRWVSASVQQENRRRLPCKTCKPVIQMNLGGEIVREFPSIREAARVTGCAAPNIIAACKGRLKSLHGYMWSYKENKKTTVEEDS